MEFKRKVTNEQSSNLLGQMIYKFKPHWPIFLLLVIIGIGCGWIYLRFATPIYETSATLLIKDERKGTIESKTIESLDQLSSKKIIENEMEVIQSNSLISNVVKQLHLYAQVYQKQKFRDVLAFSSSPIDIQIEAVDDIEPVENVKFSFNKQDSTVIIDNSAYPINKWILTTYGKVKFTAKPVRKLVDGSNFYFSLLTPKSVVASIKQRLLVTTTNKMTSILNLNFRDEDPKRGEAILNEILNSYNKAIVQEKKTLADNTLKFIDERLRSAEQDLHAIEAKIQTFKAKSNAVDIGTQGRLFLENVSNNDQKVSDINMQLAVLEQLESYVKISNNSIGVVPSTLGVSDPTLSQLVDRLYTTELEYERLKKTTAENSPTLISIVDRIEKIKPSIISNIQSQKRSLLASRRNLSTTNSNYSSVLKTIPQKERELIDINREQGIKSNIYTFLLQKKEETALSYASNMSDNSIINNAESSDKPVSPKKKIVYLSSVLIALLCGMCIVLIRESLNGKILSIREIEQLSGLPIIGEIGIESSKNPIAISDGRKTLIGEQFRRLRMSLSYIGINSKHKKILVTSAISGEGKSFVATNLASTLALTNKKVVLVDFDLNNPSISSQFQISKKRGVTEFLKGECSLEEIIQTTTINPNLFIICAGTLPSNPTELLMSELAEELIRSLEENFDYIIIDIAPVMPVTDAYIISQYCDATLYVVRYNYTPKVFIEKLDHNNRINHLKNAAIVFNSITSRGLGSTNYGYGYNYDNKHSRKMLSNTGS